MHASKQDSAVAGMGGCQACLTTLAGPLRRKPRGRRRRVVGTLDAPAALVLERAPGRPLAAKPDLVSLLRCRWPPGAAFAPAWAARVAAGVAAALAHLHGLGVRPAR